MNLRVTGIGVGVLIALALPLAAATAGPLSDEGRGGLLTSLGLRDDERGGGARAEGARPEPKAPETDTRCGPELSSPEGVEAQTCVLGEAGRVWARTYYRNATGRPLDAVLTLMGPAGRTVQIRCPLTAGDEPGTCETPKEAPAGAAQGRGRGLEEYSAVAEFAVPDVNGPLLLRAGSNSEPVTER
ncbi:hypothetical protein [Streptomyces sp. NPDC101132]|uniref:hypothetical protein n=1 Tax=Streptomyces sp. NPDC101132 TaxID=3366110 RepID=UPI00380B7380